MKINPRNKLAKIGRLKVRFNPKLFFFIEKKSRFLTSQKIKTVMKIFCILVLFHLFKMIFVLKK